VLRSPFARAALYYGGTRQRPFSPAPAASEPRPSGSAFAIWPVSTGIEVDNQMFVKQCHLLWCRRLEHVGPLAHRIAFHRWILPGPASNPLEEDIYRCREIMQLN